MRRIVVDMQNALFTDAIAAALRNFDSDFEVFESELPKKICRRCKIVLTVDENNEKNAADRVRRAKKDGLIDGFLYGSVSSAYLAAFIDTL